MWDSSIFALFNIVFKSSYSWILVIFNACKSSSSFSWHKVCQCKFLDVDPSTPTSIFLSKGPFVWFHPLSILRIIPSIIQSGQSTCLFLWWDFFCRAWFPVVFSFVKGNLFWFLFHLCLMVSPSNILKYLFSGHSDSFLIWQFYSVICLFLLFIMNLAHFFLCQNLFLHPGCIFLLFVSDFPVHFFDFLQTVWCRPSTWGDWSFLVIL